MVVCIGFSRFIKRKCKQQMHILRILIGLQQTDRVLEEWLVVSQRGKTLLHPIHPRRQLQNGIINYLLPPPRYRMQPQINSQPLCGEFPNSRDKVIKASLPVGLQSVKALFLFPLGCEMTSLPLVFKRHAASSQNKGLIICFHAVEQPGLS